MAQDWVDGSKTDHKIFKEIFPDEPTMLHTIQPQVVAVIISAAARLEGSIDIAKFSSRLSQSFASQHSQTELGRRFRALQEVVVPLRNQRLHDACWTVIAMMVYICGVIAVFLSSIGVSANPSGDEVAPSMMLVSLLPLLLLSNAIGNYACWELSEKTLREFSRDVGIRRSQFLKATKKNLIVLEGGRGCVSSASPTRLKYSEMNCLYCESFS